MSWFANFKKINTMDSNDHPKALVDILPTDKKLHQRESQWLGVIQKYESAFLPFKDLGEEELDCVSPNSGTSDDEKDLIEFGDENAINPGDDIVEIEEDNDDDYQLFTEMLSDARKAVVERKKQWEETGESFILDHFSTEMPVDEWVRQNLEDEEVSTNLDISTIYGNKCKEKKLQSTFLERKIGGHESGIRPSLQRRYSTDQDLYNPRTPHRSWKPMGTRVSKSESTHVRRSIAPPTAIKRGMIQAVKRLSTVPESPSQALNAEPIRRSYSIGDLKLPRQRTVIYSPMQPIVQDVFKGVLKRNWFDPHRTLIYEPPSDANSSSESDDDIFLACKRKFGGKVYEI